MKAAAAAAFVVVKTKLALELLVAKLDHPPQPGEKLERLGRAVGWEAADP